MFTSVTVLCLIVIPVTAYIIIGTGSPNGLYSTQSRTSPKPTFHKIQSSSKYQYSDYRKSQKYVYVTERTTARPPLKSYEYNYYNPNPTSHSPYRSSSKSPYLKPYLMKPQLKDRDLYPLNNPDLQRRIEQYHNDFRRQVQPPASNMLYMHWNAEAARQAQKYADVCKFVEHNSWKDRIMKEYGSCGQNLFGSQVKLDWYTAIESWFSEYVNFTYGSDHNVFTDIGHYTTMVWATTHQVGCGVAFCMGGPWGQFYNYVCHYCPAGNYDYYPYKIGPSCADCPHHCVWGSLCTNSCPSLDTLGNCEELLVEPDICYSGECNATCWCSDKIYKNYPWV